ncbi:MAG: bifunctional adenosylcobinamide kinase/adenosylcobinamide-phosphate guanylyltransferase [Desulfobacterales bacterium]|nr:bifunctional adenosylcobinamide kinase/adenosylcobinamide-phosphate guanylyltransferase [Desulfobacterales bacterium]
MKEIVLVIGGCRSGKSTYALQTAEKIPGGSKIFIATCVPQDDEMKQRVARHQKERSQNWATVEAPLNLPEAIRQNSRRADVILIDCLTLWVSNLLMQSGDEKKITGTIPQLIDALEEATCPIVLVSNEVGTGIVPDNPLARQFRDITGWVNQAVAKCAHQVVWMVAGIAVAVKG